MKKVEAPTLEEAYKKASEVLGCSISELQCEVLQHPTKGILGFLKKNAIIVATVKQNIDTQSSKKDNQKEKEYLRVPSIEERVGTSVMESIEEDRRKPISTELKKDPIVDNFFNEKTLDTEKIDDVTLESEDEVIVYDELALMIENQLKELLSHSCFDIDVVEVDVVDNTALIFIDGNDAALLIGKEGYRYNALSYILFNWLHTKYELFIKLEIAEFLTTQQEMIKSYIQPVIEQAESTGRAKTRFLDGILVQIALEQLRERFPNKYVAVKTSRDGKKFVVINEFNTKINA